MSAGAPIVFIFLGVLIALHASCVSLVVGVLVNGHSRIKRLFGFATVSCIVPAAGLTIVFANYESRFTADQKIVILCLGGGFIAMTVLASSFSIFFINPARNIDKPSR